METNFAIKFEDLVAGLTETKTKPNPKLKFELKFWAELCNIAYKLFLLQYCMQMVSITIVHTKIVNSSYSTQPWCQQDQQLFLYASNDFHWTCYAYLKSYFTKVVNLKFKNFVSW